MISEDDLKEHGYDLTGEQVKALNEHYHDPKNRWALKKYNARGVGRNPDNHGQVDMYVLANDEDKIVDIGYEFNGCPTISFSASIFTEEVKGLAMIEANALAQTSLDEVLAKDNCEECSTMILLAFLATYENYQNRKNGKEEEFAIKMIETTMTYNTDISCG